MPQSPSAIKRMRSDARKRTRNVAALSELKNLKKALRSVLAEQSKKGSTKKGDAAESETAVRRYISRVDSAARRGIIPKGRANRMKSRISIAFGKLGSAPAK